MNVATRRILIHVALIGLFASGCLVGEARVVGADNVGAWIGISLVTAFASTLTIDLIWLAWQRYKPNRFLSVLDAVAYSALIGGVFALSQYAAMRALGLVGERDPLVAAISSIVTITIVGMAVIAFLNGRRREEERRRHLLEEGIAVSLARDDVTDIVSRMQVVLSTGIDDALAPARRSIEEQLADQSHALNEHEWKGIAQELRKAAEETVRPLSRELWSSTAGRLAPVSAKGILLNIITRQPFRPTPLALILIVTSFANSITLYGWGVGLAMVALGITIIFVILGIANAAMSKWPNHHVAIFIGGALLLETGTLINFPLRAWQQVQPYTWGEAISAIIFGLLFIVLTSGAGSLRMYRDDAARTFQASIDRELIESIATSRQVAQLARESARILHGSVQTRLIACAVAIERATVTRDVQAFQVALREARDVLTDPGTQEKVGSTTLDDEVQRKVALWSGLCVIEVEIAGDLGALNGRTARDVGRVVEEGLSNAIRHGDASVITVRISDSGGRPVIVVEDNGRGPGTGRPGLGSSMLDSVSQSWDLTPLAQGTRLSVKLS